MRAIRLQRFVGFKFFIFTFWLWVCPTNVLLRFINIALLCIQENAFDWPTISDVILMFNKETAFLPSLKQPTFSFAKDTEDFGSSKLISQICSVNDVIVSILEAQ